MLRMAPQVAPDLDDPAIALAAPVRDPYDLRANAETFDLEGWLATLDPQLMGTSEGRRVLTRLSPALFAVTYLRHHLLGRDGRITFADAHLDWFRQARQWVRPAHLPAEDRMAWIAPRACGKSTMAFLALPAWAAAHGFTRFIAAFADSAVQSETHLASFKHELDSNQLLRQDFPDLCAAAKRPSGANMADTKSMFIAKSGFVFAARGIDASSLGLKVGEQRPDLILADDVEPDESSYSAYQAAKRLTTLQDAVLPLNIYARVLLVGTVTMPGSIVHQLSKHAQGIETADWIRDENFKVRHYRPIIKRDDGTERSIWPAKWSAEYLQSIRHTRGFAKNYDNSPLSADGDYWSPEDFRYPEQGEALDPAPRMLLSVDPAVTSKATSDFTGLSVVSHDPRRKRCTVHAAVQVKLPPAALREKVLAMLDEFPEVGLVLVEDNQGGDVWRHIFHGLPVKLKTVHQSVSKEVRAASVLNHYQRGRVIHARPLRDLEEQMCAFPKAPFDDMLDSVVSAVQRFLDPGKRKVATADSASYL